MVSNKIISEEIKLLQEYNILDENDTVKTIKIGMYGQPEWAEIFWRRKERHANRPDPEIAFVKELLPGRVLEIGSAYGRVTRKILELSKDLDVVGVEINANFDEYIKQYYKEYPEVSKATFKYGNFLEAKTFLSSEDFDIIVIPMNTVPNFPFELLDSLLQNLNYVVKEGGRCIFSVHNHKIDNNTVQLNKDDFGGELLVSKRKNPIATIVYSFPIAKTTYGFSEVTYIIHHFLNKKMCSKRKMIARTVTEFVSPDKLENLILKNGFKIDFVDDKTFSKVYRISKI